MCGQILTGATHKAGDSRGKELSEVVHDGHAVVPCYPPFASRAWLKKNRRERAGFISRKQDMRIGRRWPLVASEGLAD